MFSMTWLAVKVKVSIRIWSNHSGLYDKLSVYAFPFVDSESETTIIWGKFQFQISSDHNPDLIPLKLYLYKILALQGRVWTDHFMWQTLPDKVKAIEFNGRMSNQECALYSQQWWLEVKSTTGEMKLSSYLVLFISIISLKMIFLW